MIRLDKFLADCKLGSRSDVKKFIKAKQISVNGEVAKTSDMKINEESDIVCYKGQPICYEKFVYYLLHKPAGCVTAKQDNVHKTVMEYLPPEIRDDVSPVGRLDLDTEGLLLFTNDGDLTHHLLSPVHHIEKTYFAKLDGKIPEEAADLFEKGVDIGDDKPTLPATLEIIRNDETTGEYWANLTISEGRFHQVNRMFKAVGCNVIYLKRLSMGGLTLGDLPLGEWKKLSQEELKRSIL